MAAYSIVLNLKGNANTKAEALANALGRANTNAKSLAANLALVGAGLNGMDAEKLRGFRSAPTTRRPVSPIPTTQTQPNYTRHRATRIASYGTGFNLGGFSGRFSTILQPDADGKLFGMDAERLIRNVNFANIAGSIVTSVTMALVKATAVATVAPIATSGLIMMGAIRALGSQEFADGVKLLTRRRQAEAGLGQQYEAANSAADFISSAYGFDRSNALSSINVLTGLGIGGSQTNKLSLGDATSLTKIGGLIAQQSGASYEKVMTNLQQLLVQDTPHLRDIRELLNAAPILGKYALKEMESEGVSGDLRTYLKDQSNLLSVLKTYELDNATNAGMQARGKIQLAQQDAWAQVASNDTFWRFIGEQGSTLIGSVGGAANSLMTKMAENPYFQTSVRRLSMTFDLIADKGATFIDKLMVLVEKLADRWDIDLVSDRVARERNDQSNALTYAVDARSAAIRKMWEESSLPQSKTEKGREREFNEWLNNIIKPAVRSDQDLQRAAQPAFKLSDVTERSAFSSILSGNSAVDVENRSQLAKAKEFARDARSKGLLVYNPEVGSKDLLQPASANASYVVQEKGLLGAIQAMIAEQENTQGSDLNLGANGTGGTDLTGFNSDRRALEIHFHEAIVEWNSTINSNNPEEVVEMVGESIETLASEAIQKALLGASQKMQSSWY